jgi:hypothetical protein
MVALTCNHRNLGAVIGRIKVHENPSQITRAKRTRDGTQAVECLLCKYKAMSSNPTCTKQKKKNEW